MQHLPTFLGASPTSCSIPALTARAIRTAVLLSLVLMTCVLCSGMDNATAPQTTPTIVTNPTVGPPTTSVTVAGSGFDPYAAVDIYFDKTDMALVTTNGSGGFAGGSVQLGTAIQVPASAVPGTHWITAVERHNFKAAQKPFLVRTDWAEWQHDSTRAGANPYENVLSPTTVGSLNLYRVYELWANPQPVVVGDDVYVVGIDPNNGGNYLYAFDAGGNLMWSYNVGVRGSVISAPAVVKGVAYVGSDDGNLYAFNARTGKMLWNYSMGEAGLYSSPAAVQGSRYDTLYFTFSPYTGCEAVWALNADTGARLWVWDHCTSGLATSASVAVANGLVYAIIGPYSEGTYYSLWAFDAGTGGLRWEYDLSSPEPIDVPSPAVANSVVYLAFADTLYALRVSDGSRIWQYSTGTSIASAPVVANGVVYVGADQTYALDAATGALRWQSPSVGTEYAAANGVLYVAGGSALYALDAGSGAVLWQYADVGPTSPVVTDGTLYAGSSEGNLLAFGLPDDGSSQQFALPEQPNPRLLVPDYSLRPNALLTTRTNSH
ncbi:MAG: PQQ-binding-like beta-propeller repeat protein [Candidatus Korobacteraceae bacterium]|jgi:outer membrane protein assembly factor BamB